MIYSFDTELAAEIGLNEAILLQNIAYWVNGCYWTYNSAAAFSKLYPFWTPRVIKYALAKLQQGEYIKAAQYNKDKMNHTNWYTLTEKGWLLISKHGQQKQEQQQEPVQNESIDGTKLSNRRYKNDFPSIYTNIKHTDNKQGVRARAREAPPFENPSPSLVDAWNGFVEMRKLIKKPLTPRASKLTADNLQKLAPDDDEHKAAILNQSVQNCWQGVFPLHDDWSKKRASPKPRGQQSVQDMTDETMEILRRQGLV